MKFSLRMKVCTNPFLAETYVLKGKLFLVLSDPFRRYATRLFVILSRTHFVRREVYDTLGYEGLTLKFPEHFKTLPLDEVCSLIMSLPNASADALGSFVQPSENSSTRIE